MVNPLRAAEWPHNDEGACAVCGCAWEEQSETSEHTCPQAFGGITVPTNAAGNMEAYAAYLLSELEREFEAKLDAIHDVDALIHWASESAEAVAAFRKRVMGERK